MILLAVGFLCIIASFFLNKHELTSQEADPDPDPVTDPEPETKENVQEEAPATDPGAGSN